MFAFLWPKEERYRYTAIETGQDPQEKPQQTQRNRFSLLLFALAWLGTAALLGIASSAALHSFDKSSEWFPRVPMRTYTFDQDLEYSQPPNSVSNAAWDRLMPHGRGRVVVDQPWQYGLQSVADPPLPSEEYGVSVFHQLHCLGVLRYSWFALLGDQDETVERPLHHLAPAAALHCFDFLRQAIMCSADTTMEPARYLHQDGTIHTAHGWGVEHRCKDWDAVWEHTVRYHAHDNRTGIL